MKTYELQQVLHDPRDPAKYGTRTFGSYTSLAEAKQAATVMHDWDWIIVEIRIVANSRSLLAA